MSDLFRGFIEFGGEMLGRARTNDPVAVRYRGLLAHISIVFHDTHELVIEKLSAIEDANTKAEAAALVQELRGEPLSQTFRNQGLCDTFQALGDALHSASTRAFHNDGEPVGFAFDLAAHLADREREVAQMYEDQIDGMRELLAASDAADLDAIRKHAAAIRARLDAELGDFERLADSLRSMRTTRVERVP